MPLQFGNAPRTRPASSASPWAAVAAQTPLPRRAAASASSADGLALRVTLTGDQGQACEWTLRRQIGGACGAAWPGAQPLPRSVVSAMLEVVRDGMPVRVCVLDRDTWLSLEQSGAINDLVLRLPALERRPSLIAAVEDVIGLEVVLDYLQAQERERGFVAERTDVGRAADEMGIHFGAFLLNRAWERLLERRADLELLREERRQAWRDHEPREE